LRTPKLSPNHKIGIKTIFNHFCNIHARANSIIIEIYLESRSSYLNGMKEVGSPKLLFEKLDSTPLHPIHGRGCTGTIREGLWCISRSVSGTL